MKVDFLPDNLTWTKEGRLLAAGVKGARGDCPEGSGRPCIQGFGVAEIDPAKMQVRPIFDSANHDPLIGGVSLAFDPGRSSGENSVPEVVSALFLRRRLSQFGQHGFVLLIVGVQHIRTGILVNLAQDVRRHIGSFERSPFR